MVNKRFDPQHCMHTQQFVDVYVYARCTHIFNTSIQLQSYLLAMSGPNILSSSNIGCIWWLCQKWELVADTNASFNSVHSMLFVRFLSLLRLLRSHTVVHWYCGTKSTQLKAGTEHQKGDDYLTQWYGVTSFDVSMSR